MKESKDELLGLIRNKNPMTDGQLLRLAILLATPAILAQISSVLMQYIDAAMVGHLGANPAASIGLVSTSTWILNGFFMALMSGFSVQVAHKCGAKDFIAAKNLLRQGLASVFLFTCLLAIIGALISSKLPYWLGGTSEIISDATRYFLIFTAFMPIGSIGYTASAMLQASGNMKVPSIMYVTLALLDVVFNYLFIYILDLGVAGAALGTGAAETMVSIFAVWYATCKSEELNLKREKGSFIPDRIVIKNALSITGPLCLQNIIMRGAYIMCTIIVAPLGAVAIAANTFAITAESFCYMPGFGLQEAATTLVGQSFGAGRKDIARRLSNITVLIATVIMTFLAILMYIFAPTIMGLLTSDGEVAALGSKVLRIEAFAETLYAVSIVAYGVFVGAGDTLLPSILNFGSIWLIRIGLALVLTPKYGLAGYWIAMCIELNARGIIFFFRLRGDKWLKKKRLI
ncbi:MAG: MATE family efflux transporter [Candidatus Cryptobacteroides sp.]|jgi:putative efflux protein, MATE family